MLSIWHGLWRLELTRRTASDKILYDKSFNIAKIPKCDGYQRGLASTVYIFFGKKISGSGIKNENVSNKDLKNYTNQLLQNLIKEKYTHLL